MPRPKGLPKTGGRAKGAKNRRTVELEKIAQKAAAKGIAPLDYMLKIMRNPKADPWRRCEMAKALAPYFHPKPRPVNAGGETVPSAVYLAPDFGDS
jgi:hypothetical protein